MSVLKLFRQTWTGRYEPHGDVQTADCVVGFAFGVESANGKPVPGVSNEDLAAVVLKLPETLPLILQWEIAAALPPASPARTVSRINQHRRPGVHLDTREVAEQALL